MEENTPRSNEGDPWTAECLHFSFSFRSLFVDKRKLNHMFVWFNLFGHSPCRNSRRDKNKFLEKLDREDFEDMEGIQTITVGLE